MRIWWPYFRLRRRIDIAYCGLTRRFRWLPERPNCYFGCPHCGPEEDEYWLAI
jgi:hypothetical protein